MTTTNKEFWDKLKRPPKEALRQIAGGRLKGKSDINPQWRYEIMTEIFGVCGVGWKFEIVETWTEKDVPELQVVQMAKVLLYVLIDSGWSDPIPGIGGSMLVAAESNGLYTNDEALKMAVTDALGTAMKMLGVAADVYKGLWDGVKYNDKPNGQKKTSSKQESTTAPGLTVIKNVTFKSDKYKPGHKKAGQTWTKYTITDGNDKTYSTFSKSHADIAKTAMKKGAEVLFTIVKQGNYENIEQIEMMDPDTGEAQETPPDFDDAGNPI